MVPSTAGSSGSEDGGSPSHVVSMENGSSSHQYPTLSSSPSPSSSSPSVPIPRARGMSDHNQLWDADTGGNATYLPAPPSPSPRSVSPAPGLHGTATRRRRDQSPGPAGSSTRKALPQLNLSSPLPLSLGLNKSDANEPLLNPVASASIHSDAHSHAGSIMIDSTSIQSSGSDGDDGGFEITHGGDDDDEPDDIADIPSYRPPPVSHSHKLGQWMATGISGNDITSSCLYVTGLCVADAGIWAPVCLLMVVVTLWMFRKIYGEAVTALPLNGGAYNLLLNCTSKSTAALAACLTILSYVATAVVSGSEAIHYLHILWPGLNVTVGTIILLSIFALLTIMGITDSARVAFAIFATHIATMSTLAIVVIVHISQNGAEMLVTNYHSTRQPVLWRAIVYGFSSAMLGVSGFESSANFVEEQKNGVFVKTLRNMWGFVSFFNPLLTFLSLTVLSQDFMADPANQPTVLAEMGRIAGGAWLENLVSADAFCVLSGGVLTSFVGVTGLCRRLALDRCLPQVLLAENKWRHTNHWIILGFLGVCSSMFLILNGDVDSLSNVYSVSFLSVMGLFCIGNMLLKYKRGKLQREVTAPWAQVFLALSMICLALAGLLAKKTEILVVWCIYFLITGSLVATMFFRIQSLKILYSALRAILGRRGATPGTRSHACLHSIAATIKDIGSQSIGFFAKSGKLSVLNKAILYVRANEECASVRIIHVYESEEKIPPNLLRNVKILDEAYPKIKIDLVLVPGLFSPDVIDYLSQQLNIPKNLMFITCPTEDFTHKIETLGGVRLITH